MSELAQLQAAMQDMIPTLGNQPDDWLVDQLMEARGSHDSRVVEEYAKFKTLVREEVLKRMSS